MHRFTRVSESNTFPRRGELLLIAHLITSLCVLDLGGIARAMLAACDQLSCHRPLAETLEAGPRLAHALQ